MGGCVLKGFDGEGGCRVSDHLDLCSIASNAGVAAFLTSLLLPSSSRFSGSTASWVGDPDKCIGSMQLHSLVRISPHTTSSRTLLSPRLAAAIAALKSPLLVSGFLTSSRKPLSTRSLKRPAFASFTEEMTTPSWSREVASQEMLPRVLPLTSTPWALLMVKPTKFSSEKIGLITVRSLRLGSRDIGIVCHHYVAFLLVLSFFA